MDAAAVFYLDQALPTYYEVSAQVAVIKPTAGWKANAYLIFDYVSPTDFKFAGLDQSTNKVVLGHRTAAGWVYDFQANMQVRADQYYGLLVVVNGLVVTVLVDGVARATYRYAPRQVDGAWYGLEYGLVGVGSDNSRGSFDNFSVQVLPPLTTLDETETFADGVGDRLTGGTGTWTVVGERLVGAVVGEDDAAAPTALSLLELPGRPSGTDVELEALVGGGGSGGFVFDHYNATDYKFVALDRSAGTVSIGHVIRGKLVIDSRFAVALPAGDVRVTLKLSGTTVEVRVGGVLVGSFSYHGPVLDGGLGMLVAAGTASFDDVRTFIGTRLVNAVDGVAPVLTVPPDVVVAAPAGATAVVVPDSTLGVATATDDTLLASLVRSGVPAGNLFAIGTHTITWTATDVFGNVTVGTQLVTVAAPPSGTVVGVAATDAVGSEPGTDTITFAVSRTGDLSAAITVGLAWSGTASFGKDYKVSVIGGTLNKQGTAVTLAAGVASVTIVVTVLDDKFREPTESVLLAVLAGSAYTLGTASAGAEIRDDDGGATASTTSTTTTTTTTTTPTTTATTTTTTPTTTTPTTTATTTTTTPTTTTLAEPQATTVEEDTTGGRRASSLLMLAI